MIGAKMALAIMIFTLVLCVVFLGAAAAMWWNQERTLRNARPVSAVIVGSAVVSGRNSEDEQVCYPAITYQMDLPSSHVIGTKLYPSGEDRYYTTTLQAQKIADQFQVGQAVQAMADPADPTRCFLIARRTELWWIFALLGVVVAGAGVANYVTKGSKFNP